MDGPGTAVRVAPTERRADEWAVVLAAAGIEYWTRHRLDGWALLVSPADSVAALEALDAYDRENSVAPAVGVDGPAGTRSALIVGLGVALLLIDFFSFTGSRATRSEWFERGSADAERIVAGEWWRAVTALTLHADAFHALGNAVSSAFLITMVGRSLGPGVGLWLVLLSGVGGNLLTAVVHGSRHVSVGASTSIFGAIGLLAALRISAPRLVGSRSRRSWVVVAASLALLALLGVGENADLLAHFFGLLVGGGLGLVVGPALRSIPPAVVQWPLVAGAVAAVLLAWRLAF